MSMPCLYRIMDEGTGSVQSLESAQPAVKALIQINLWYHNLLGVVSEAYCQTIVMVPCQPASPLNLNQLSKSIIDDRSVISQLAYRVDNHVG